MIPHPCASCGGDGRVRARRTVPVKVPAGVEDGMRIRLSGQGEVGPGGGPAGDLYIEIHELPHDIFTREGDDLHCRVSLPMTAAALGTSLTLDTLDGEEKIDIRPGTQPDTVVPLRARGVPHLRGVGRGDLHVHVSVKTPTRLDDGAGAAAARAGPAARRGPARVHPGAGWRRAVLQDAGRVQRPVSTPPVFLVDSLPDGGETVLRRGGGPPRGRGTAAAAG